MFAYHFLIDAVVLPQIAISIPAPLAKIAVQNEFVFLKEYLVFFIT